MGEGEQEGVSSSDTASDSIPAAASIQFSACPQGKGGVHYSSVLSGVICLRRAQLLSFPCTLHLLPIPHMPGEAQNCCMEWELQLATQPIRRVRAS